MSLTVDGGSLCALVGPNGCGKSTLLSALSGCADRRREPSASTATKKKAIGHRDLARERSLVTQTNRTDTPFTVAEVVQMGRFPWLRTPQAVQSPQIIADAIAECDLGDILDRPFSQLSGGRKPGVLGRASPNRPGDASRRTYRRPRHPPPEAVLDILRRQRDQGTAVLIVVHDLSLAAAYADQVAVMKQGRLAAHGPTPKS